MLKITHSVLCVLGWSSLLIVLCFAEIKQANSQVVDGTDVNADEGSSDEGSSVEEQFLSGVRQITFEGKRAGEGYFSSDASLMVFQSERRADNPFYQMYLLDFTTGDIENISPGHGKTTCGWIHPDNNRVLLASTHEDPEARKKQKAELEFRESGQSRRYSWDYDENYELYAYDRTAKTYKRLTNAKGYDAEGSYSPDGQQIVFASNRNAYSQKLTEREQKMFDVDLAYMMDIFIMDADGTNVRQLTQAPGYDGGPFFSPDGKKICWRRFSENGLRAEIMTMNIDGSQQRTITNMKKMSWAPFYHPSGEYLVFNTNEHGFKNFELYIVDAEGKSKPVRVTDTDKFDGLASFTSDGKQMTWTSQRGSSKTSQVHLADWNHDAAMKALKVSKTDTAQDSAAFETGKSNARQSSSEFRPADIVRHVRYLCRPELKGRMTGSAGEKKAVSYVAAYFDHLKLKPAGDNGKWFQKFDFPDGAELLDSNKLQLVTSDADQKQTEAVVDKDWRPLTFSGNVEVPESEVVFAGYGIVAPEKGDFEEYDSYVHLDVKDKWVLVFRFVPEDASTKLRRHLQFYGGLRKKAFYARQRGAKGLIVVSGPTSQVRKQLVPLRNDFSPSGSSIAAISVTDAMAEKMLAANGKDLKALQKKFDSGEPNLGFKLKPSVKLAATVGVNNVTGIGRNVLGRLQAGDKPSDEVIVVGAHIDHLGSGKSGGSLAKEDSQNAIHFGADDNASGVAAMLEIAEYLSYLKKKGKLDLKRDVIFAGWSGEELGLHGSKHFAKTFLGEVKVDEGIEQLTKYNPPHDFDLRLDAKERVSLNGQLIEEAELDKSIAFLGKNFPKFTVVIKAHGDCRTGAVEALKKKFSAAGLEGKLIISILEEESVPQIVAALNMDMVGRLTDKLVLQGVSSSPVWPSLVETKNAVVGLPVSLSDETDLPTDASSFYQIGVPILSAFTGSHRDYHTPRDTPEKLNYRDNARIARLMGLITRSLAIAPQPPKFVKQSNKPKQVARAGLRAYLGTVPSYGDDVVGVLLDDTTEGAPAHQAGVRGGDLLIGLAGEKIENIYDYTAILDTLKIGRETTIKVRRGDNVMEFKITPSSRK